LISTWYLLGINQASTWYKLGIKLVPRHPLGINLVPS
jgi:hypothetical protein